jgi:hypothetical protein
VTFSREAVKARCLEPVIYQLVSGDRPVRAWVQGSKARARSERPILAVKAVVLGGVAGEDVRSEATDAEGFRHPGFGDRGRPLAAARRVPLERLPHLSSLVDLGRPGGVVNEGCPTAYP